MTLLKRTLFLCIWCNAMCSRSLRLKTHYFPHTVHYCCSSLPCLYETCRFLQSSSFWRARCALIGQLSSALWLAKYLKHVTEMLHPIFGNTQHLHDMAVVATMLQRERKLCLLSLRKHLGGVMQIFPHSDFLLSDEYNQSYINECPGSSKLCNGSEWWSRLPEKCNDPS